MEFRVLGPLEVSEQGALLSLGGGRQRAVLAYLILEANRVVPTERLIDRIWGDEPPDAAREALFAYISRLRRLLGPDRIQARPPGYILIAERDEIDALHFADLVDRARAQGRDREGAASLLTQALDLWRGNALADLAEYDALRPPIARLEELRLGAVEDRIDAEIDLGRHREVIPQLEGLTGDHPLRERLWGQLMLSLYRSGRQGDSLGAFHRARTNLVEELGIDPSPELQRLQQRILNQDPGLDAPKERGPEHPPQHPPEHPRASTAGPDRRRFRPLAAAATVGLVLVAGVWWVAHAPTGLPPGTWKIGLDMPLSGPAAGLGQPVRNAVELAIKDLTSSGGIQGSTLALSVRDDGHNPALAAGNARAFVADPATVALIGPWGSAQTFEVIPVTNEAGLLECSPSATHPGLTKARDGALDLRVAHPDRISFVRLAPADDIQASALASFAYHDLRARYVLVVDDASDGRVIADAFAAEFGKLGGSTVRRALNPGADPRLILAPLGDATIPPGLVFFGGSTESGGAAIRLAMAETGHASIPLLSWDALLDGDGDQRGSYLERTGASAIGSFVAHASLPDQKASFAEAYRQQFGAAPDEYAAAGYACVEIVTAALREIARQGPTASELRELVRAHLVDPTRRYETVLGTVGFDANGDALRQFVTFYRVEASAAGGSGDWVIFKKQDFGPAR